ncbi:hypothetical protein BGZ67_001040 [Mortierella alpina]|nr:hypothetical protein BGZ67_001040 [Mortierella alpina]
MRVLSAPLLVQAIANKSVCLYLYQEYVRRVGIKFVFDHFDLARDRIVFRPEVADNQYRFRSGLTLQNPQLEEIAITTTGRAIQPYQVQQSGERYFTVRQPTNAGKQALPKSKSQPIPPPPPPASSSSTPSLSASAVTESPVLSTAVSATEAAESPISAPRKRTTDEKVYHGAKNFLDKTCPVHVRRSGIRQVDGTRHSFLQDYPWAMHYQVDHEQLPFSTDGNTDKSSIAGSNQNPFFFNVRQHIHHSPVQAVRGDAGAPDAGDQTAVMSSSQDGAFLLPSERSHESTEQAVLSKPSGTPGSGPRYLRFLMFECSMKFLDPKRATRNIIGRWLEGKVQRWKNILGGMRHQTAAISQQPTAMPNTMQTDDGFNGLEIRGHPLRRSSSKLMGSGDLTDHDLDHDHDPDEELIILPGSSSTGHPVQQALRSLEPMEFRPYTVKAF